MSESLSSQKKKCCQGIRGKPGQTTVASIKTWRVSPAEPPQPLTAAEANTHPIRCATKNFQKYGEGIFNPFHPPQKKLRALAPLRTFRLRLATARQARLINNPTTTAQSNYDLPSISLTTRDFAPFSAARALKTPLCPHSL